MNTNQQTDIKKEYIIDQDQERRICTNEKTVTLHFSGYSESTFGEYGVTKTSFQYYASQGPIQCLIETENDQLLVIGRYVSRRTHISNNCWMIGISTIENQKMPDWPIRYGKGKCPYSPTLTIDVPEHCKLTWYMNRKRINEVEI